MVKEAPEKQPLTITGPNGDWRSEVSIGVSGREEGRKGRREGGEEKGRQETRKGFNQVFVRFPSSFPQPPKYCVCTATRSLNTFGTTIFAVYNGLMM